MKISKNELKTIGQALSFAVMFSHTEAETAEFAVLKIKIEGEIERQAQDDHIRKNTLCRSCNEPLDKYAIISTHLCTACFTSNS
jgi:hypothetical protein